MELARLVKSLEFYAPYAGAPPHPCSIYTNAYTFWAKKACQLHRWWSSNFV